MTATQDRAITGHTRHRILRAAEIVPAEAWPESSSGLRRAELVSGATGAVHMGLGLVELAAAGHIEMHVHSHEESFYVLEGEPVLIADGAAARLAPGACGILPVGQPHAWRSESPARWIDMRAPRPRDADQPPDTYLVAAATGDAEVREIDVRDPRNRNLFRLSESDMDVERLKAGASVGAPSVSASMATAALLYSGITVKMLVDRRNDAQLSTMFMVDYQPHAVAHPHDHPFEEAYYMLAGEVDVVADGERYTLLPGDAFWTGVGCIHAFYETRGGRVRWLETSAPAPPDRHSYRFERDWNYLAEQLPADAALAAQDGPG
jgi:quercetin dioxygenase-like cupin family protein